MISIKDTPIAVLGAGAWGTALAILLANNNQPVRLWSHDAQHAQRLVQERSNTNYLPGILFPEKLTIALDLPAAVADVNDILVVVPSHAFSDVLLKLHPYLTDNMRLAWGSKGLDPKFSELLHVVAKWIVGEERSLAALSGPSFAREVALGLPTAITVAAQDAAFAADLVERLSNPKFRVYTSSDMVSVGVCGVVKNILAIAAGIIAGLQLGANTLSALITRGLVEMTRLAIAMGGEQITCMGLAGVGDMFLTCSDNQSRNRRFGIAIGSGKTIEETLQNLGQTVEGWRNSKIVHEMAIWLDIDMPICEYVYQVLYKNLSPAQAINQLFARDLREEVD